MSFLINETVLNKETALRNRLFTLPKDYLCFSMYISLQAFITFNLLEKKKDLKGKLTIFHAWENKYVLKFIITTSALK